MISAPSFIRIADSGAQLFAISVEYMEQFLASKKENLKKKTDVRTLIPEEYHDLLSLFTKEAADNLPPHRYVDHAIELEEGAKPPFGPLYNMSQLELEALQDYLKENLSKGFIRASKSSAASPVLFAKKADGSLRFCVDYRGLNAITKKNRYPLPLIDETLYRLRGAKYYTRLDLRSAFNLIRMKKGHEWLTAFRTRYGLFEYVVMPMGLTNAPATCQTYVNDTLREHLDVFCVCYLDDILIYSDDLESHKRHVRLVLEKLLAAGLYVKPEKCEFHTQRTTFLGFVITPKGVSMDPKKIQAVKEWETPTTVKELQCFLGFANFYRRFIKSYSRICNPLFRLLSKDVPWSWTEDCQKAFDSLVESFCSAPILRHYDPKLPTVVEVDASDSVIGGILSQIFDKRLHPIAYASRKMTPAECNYGIGDKELLAIVYAFEEWHQYLEGASDPVTVYTDHANLQTFMTKMKLSRRQVRWAQKLAEYNFVIVYRPGPKNVKADALTRRSGDLPKEGDGRGPPVDSILRPENFLLSVVAQPLESTIKEALGKDKVAQNIIEAIKAKHQRHPKISLADCEYKDGLLLVDNLIYIPDDEALQAKIIKSCHEHPAAGHPGRAATHEILTREFWWPGMRKTIARYISNCQTYARLKPVRHLPYGHLKPLKVPERRWDSVSMDFITGLPLSAGKNAIFVVVDRLSKMAHFIPCTDEIDSEGTARLFADHVFRLHGLPRSVVSDRGSVFASKFTRALCKILQISQNMSTAYHPQTDGQTERINAVLEQFLRAYVNYQQDDWHDLLTFAEFAYNNTISSTTGVTPFFANYGQHPRYQIIQSDGPDTAVPTPDELKDFQENFEQLEKHLQAEMKYAQAVQAEYADNRRSSPPVFRPGDKAWLQRRFITTTRPSNKLDFKRLGPFEVLERVGSHAYRLSLPDTMKVHPVFHVSLLEPTPSDPLEGQTQPRPPPIIVDGDEEWEVEEILDSRKHYRQLQYLVKWVGDYAPTWEHHLSVQNAVRAVLKFHAAYPNKPRPRKLPDPPEDDTDSESESE